MDYIYKGVVTNYGSGGRGVEQVLAMLKGGGAQKVLG